MNETQLATKQIRLEQWTAIIRDRSTSGMKIDDYCEAHGLSRNAYFYWLRKVRAAALESANIDFVELKPEPEPRPCLVDTQSEESFRTEAVISVGSVRVSVNSSTSKSLLRTLLEIASHA